MRKKTGLSCTICFKRNYGIYKSNTTNRILLKKFCRTCNKQTMHQEEK